jgi:hypothetical protein
VGLVELVACRTIDIRHIVLASQLFTHCNYIYKSR